MSLEIVKMSFVDYDEDKNPVKERNFVLTPLGATAGFEFMEELIILLGKTGLLKNATMDSLANMSEVFDLESITQSAIKRGDFLPVKELLVRSISYAPSNGNLRQLTSWKDFDLYCKNPAEIFKLLMEAVKLNFGFFKEGGLSLSPTSNPPLESKGRKTSSQQKIFQMR